MAVGSSATLAAGVLKAWPGLACWDAAPVGAAVFVQAPADPILGLAVKYREDTDPNKINLGIGAYRDDNDDWVFTTKGSRALAAARARGSLFFFSFQPGRGGSARP